MRLFGILLLVLIIAAGGAYVYFGTQDWKGRQEINARALRHLLLLQGLPLDGDGFSADDETPFEAPMAGGEFTKTVSKKLLENYFKDNAGAAPAAATDPAGGPARTALATNAPVVSQSAELSRVFALIKGDLEKVKDAPAQKIELLVSQKAPPAPAAGAQPDRIFSGGWLLLLAENATERIRFQELAAPTKRDETTKAERPKTAEEVAGDAEALVHELDRKFYRVAPKLYASPAGALAPAKWEEMQKLADGAGDPATAARLKPAVATGEADRRLKLAHLLVHLDRDAAWQKRVSVVVGLRSYVSAVVTQGSRFREMRDHVDLPIAADQATYQKNQDALINEARLKGDRMRATAAERRKIEEQEVSAGAVLTTRKTQLDDLKAQLQKVRAEVDQLLVQQSAEEKRLFEAQRLVSLTLEDVYRLEALLVEVERERYGSSSAQPRP